MEKLRKYRCIEFLYRYSEEIYMVFALSLFGIMSIGKNSSYMIFKIVLPISLTAFLLKFLVTKYTKKEWIWIILIGGLLGADFCINQEQDLLYCFLLIIAAKNVDLDRVFRFAFWERLLLTIVNVGLVVLRILPNKGHVGMPKFIDGIWEYPTIYSYGYDHPNHTYFNLFTIMILGAIVYREILKWYHFIGATIVMYVAYHIIICRTGWYMWLAGLLLFAGYYLTRRIHLSRYYMYGVMMIPAFSAGFALAGTYLYRTFLEGRSTLGERLNAIFTGRFALVQPYLPQIERAILGCTPTMSEDLAYIWIIYNYGWIIFLLVLVAYICCIKKLVQYGEEELGIILAIMAGYALAERLPLNGGWNLTVILLSVVLFEKNSLGEKKCKKF